MADASIAIAVEFKSAAESCSIGCVFLAHGVEPFQTVGGLPVRRGKATAGWGREIIWSGRCRSAEAAEEDEEFFHADVLFNT